MLTGILGGSFNPPHVGHLALACTVLDLGLAERVCFIPAAVPPHKATPDQTTPEMRLAMTRLLVRDDARMEVDASELERAGVSFTIDTLRQFRERNPGSRYRLVIGSDMAKSFATWREYKEILSIAPPLVAERPDSLFSGPCDYPGLTPEEKECMASGRFKMTPVDASSTTVRRLLAEGAADAGMLRYLTAPVLAYIRKHHLYERC